MRYHELIENSVSDDELFGDGEQKMFVVAAPDNEILGMFTDIREAIAHAKKQVPIYLEDGWGGDDFITVYKQRGNDSDSGVPVAHYPISDNPIDESNEEDMFGQSDRVGKDLRRATYQQRMPSMVKMVRDTLEANAGPFIKQLAAELGRDADVFRRDPEIFDLADDLLSQEVAPRVSDLLMRLDPAVITDEDTLNDALTDHVANIRAESELWNYIEEVLGDDGDHDEAYACAMTIEGEIGALLIKLIQQAYAQPGLSEGEIDEGVNDPHIFKCIFLFGPMGAGKSTVARPLLSHTGLRSVNLDNFNEMFVKKGQVPTGHLAPDQLEKSWQLSQTQQNNFANGRLGIIIDGSGRNPDTAIGVIEKLGPLGYEFMMIFVNVSEATSIARQQSRAVKQQQQWGVGRQVDPTLAKNTYTQVQRNLGRYSAYFGPQGFVYVDNENTPDLTQATKKVDAFLRAPVRQPQALAWIKAQQGGQQVAQQQQKLATAQTRQQQALAQYNPMNPKFARQGMAENMDHDKDGRAVEELRAALVAHKDRLQSANNDQVYDIIDKIMTRIAKSHSISGQKLHDMWVDKYKQIPDTWIMNENASGIDFDMTFDDDTGSFATVTARAQGRTLGSVKFFMDGDTLEADMVEVDERYRGQGIAAAMYDYAKSQGYTIEKSSDLTPDGDHFWNKNRGEEPVWENNPAAGITKAFNNLGDPVFANLQRVALLAMQGRQQEAAGRLQTVIKGADPAVQKKITDAVNNIKPVTINGRVADSSTLDKSKQHNDWIINTFIPWVQSLLGQPVAENFADGKNPQDKGDSKRHGVPTKSSVSNLRKFAKNHSGRAAQLAHWMANMKSGKKKHNE